MSAQSIGSKHGFLISFMILALALRLSPTTSLAQDSGQTFTTTDGLRFTYPDGWGLYSTPSQIFLSTSPSAQSRNDLGLNDVYAIVMSEQQLSQLFGHFDADGIE